MIGLDPDQHLRVIVVLAQQPADHSMQRGHPGSTFRQPPAGQHLPGLVHHLDIVMVLSPVITREQPHQPSCSQHPDTTAASGRTISKLIKAVLKPARPARHPSSDSALPVTGRGTI
jgi:hypothetical protein